MIFRIGITRDFLAPDGRISFGDIGLSLLDVPGVTWDFLAESSSELRPDQIEGYDGLLVLGPKVSANTLKGNSRLAVIARFGVGYDNIDVPACTANGVALSITPDGVKRPVAVSAITFLLALSHKLLVKDRLTREGRWAEKLNHMGMGVTGRTLGVIGVGNIGREILHLAKPFDMRHLGYDPFLTTAPDGVELVSLDRLLSESDFVVVCCSLSKETHHLLNAVRLKLMKRTAYLINVARGPIIDQAALTLALQERRIAGAGLDVFDPEPISPDDPLLKLDNVILAPHAICWTDECFGNNGRSACRSLLAVANGKSPEFVVNREVLTSPAFLKKIARTNFNADDAKRKSV
jgi:phosphoglycerate dehydrogenase-like enzyme